MSLRNPDLDKLNTVFDKIDQEHKTLIDSMIHNCVDSTLIAAFTHNKFQFDSCRRRLKRYPLQVRHKQDWGRGFILLLPQTAALPGSDAGSDVIKPASSFVIQNRQTSCSMWCPMYKTRC